MAGMRVAGILLVFLLASCSRQSVVSGGPSTRYGDTGAEAHTAPAAGETEVLAEGAAAITGTAADIARDNAIDDALRKAVEQGVGAYVDAETEVSNYQLISDRIYSRTHGYVSSYRVIDETQAGGLYRVVVRAVVRTEAIEDDLAAIGILLAEQGRPRIMVVIRELSSMGELDEASSLMGGTMFETAVLDHFREKGFPVVDAHTAREALRRDQLRLMLQGDDETAALIGLRAGAEIVITGTALHIEESRMMAGSPRRMHEYRVSARAVNTETAALLAGKAMTVALPFSESQARARAADSTASYLESAILDGWIRSGNTTLLVATNASFERMSRLRSDIRNHVRGVLDVVTRDLTGSRGTMEVLSETSTEEVMDDLSSLDTGFRIIGFSGNRVELEFVD